jgi:hypothetical protein
VYGIIEDIIWPFACLSFELERKWEWGPSAFYCGATVAALWFEQSSSAIYEIFDISYKTLNDHERCVIKSIREEFAGEKGLSLARWAFWRNKFAEWSRRRDLLLSAKTHVLAAIEAMDDIFDNDDEIWEHREDERFVFEEDKRVSKPLRFVAVR